MPRHTGGAIKANFFCAWAVSVISYDPVKKNKTQRPHYRASLSHHMATEWLVS